MHRDDELDIVLDLKEAIWVALDDARDDGELDVLDIMRITLGAVEVWNANAGFETTEDLFEVWKKTLRPTEEVRPL